MAGEAKVIQNVAILRLSEGLTRITCNRSGEFVEGDRASRAGEPQHLLLNAGNQYYSHVRY